MSLEKGRITPFQYMLSVTCFLQSSALLSSFFTPITQQDSWLVVLFGMAAAMPVLIVFCAIMHSFPGKNLIEITLASLGRVAGTVVSLIFIWFFLTLTALNLRDFGQFVRQIILVETPIIVVISLCMLVSAYAVIKGLNVVTRYSPVFVLMAIILTVLATLFTLNLINLNNFLPIMTLEPIKYVQGTNIVLTIPYGELFVLLMVAPYVSKGKKSKGVYLFGGFFIGSFTILSVVSRDTAILGNTASLFSLPSFETLRLIGITEAFNRMEILFAIVLVVLLFFKITILFYCSVMAIAQLLRMKTYHPLVLVMSAFIVAYTNFVFPTAEIHDVYSRQTAPIAWFVFEFILPLLVLILGRAKGLHKQLQQGVQQ